MRSPSSATSAGTVTAIAPSSARWRGSAALCSGFRAQATRPVDRYLHEAANIETAFPLLRGVHGTAAISSDGLLFAGLGGEISDDPRHPRDERERLSYPRWEAEYRLKVVGEFDYNQLVLLFWTAPEHKGLEADRERSGHRADRDLPTTSGRLRRRPRRRGSGPEPHRRSRKPSEMASYAVADLHGRTADLQEFTSSAGRRAG